MYTRKDGDSVVSEDQIVNHREHLLSKHRILFVSGIIEPSTEGHNLLMAYDSVEHTKPFRLIINSGGGCLDTCLTLYDTLKLIRSPIETLGRFVASGAVLLLIAGSRRYLMPHSRVMLHLPSIIAGQMDAEDFRIQQAEMEKYKNGMVEVYRDCGVRKSRDEILADINREKWFNAEEAIAYGLADTVATKEVIAQWLDINGQVPT